MVSPSTRPALDAECAEALSLFPFDFGAVLGSLDDATVGQVREMFAAPPPAEAGGDVVWLDHDVSPDAAVRVRLYRPRGATGHLPCIYWMHGGGFVLGSHGEDGQRFDTWCAQHGCAAASVEYRLAPEHRYPAALDDCLAGLRWLFEHADALDVDRTRIGIGGASAGGGLAACLALRVRDETELTLAFQLMLYPMLDDRQTTRSSQADDPIWPPSANHYGWSAYLGDQKGRAEVPPHAAAARAIDLTGLPPTYLMVGTADGFIDEDIDFAERLRAAGVEVDLHVFAGGFHGFDVAAIGTKLARRANSATAEWLSDHL